MKVFAHRGFSGKYPENTMLAYRKAIEAKADGIELDIHESSDGQLVIIHDEKLVRTTGRDGVVSDYTLKELTS
ncbi:MAG: glycerophosphodiester phosphodiesterase, partial [Spirochaetales bacterium]|nr:glycerophosphodiester phosphodiesterase [Spirochaetales bacterium]